jgi:hypothetical protein
MERRLTTLLAADVIGDSRLMGEDETGICRGSRKWESPSYQSLICLILKIGCRHAIAVDAINVARSLQPGFVAPPR